MWPFTKSTVEGARRLREVLVRIKELVDGSAESDWTPFTPAEISADLDVAISRLDKGNAVDVAHLAMLFAPTGPIQETAMGAGWADEYLKLSSEFDSLAPKA
ncbi:MAG TPA: hypothetical protein PLN52_26265 [Opitutaceae bacterium]|nr:hypothetical protein [Opitutaceae bacterium]